MQIGRFCNIKGLISKINLNPTRIFTLQRSVGIILRVSLKETVLGVERLRVLEYDTEQQVPG
jgi:hypothetical protein